MNRDWLPPENFTFGNKPRNLSEENLNVSRGMLQVSTMTQGILDVTRLWGTNTEVFAVTSIDPWRIVESLESSQSASLQRFASDLFISEQRCSCVLDPKILEASDGSQFSRSRFETNSRNQSMFSWNTFVTHFKNTAFNFLPIRKETTAHDCRSGRNYMWRHEAWRIHNT